MDAVPEMCFTFGLLPFCELQLQTGAKCFFLPKSFLYWIAWCDIDNTNNVDRYCVKVNGNATRDIYCWQYIEENLSWLNFDRNSRNIYLLPYLKIAQYHENGNWYHGVATIGPSHYIHTIIFIAHIGEMYMMKMVLLWWLTAGYMERCQLSTIIFIHFQKWYSHYKPATF